MFFSNCKTFYKTLIGWVLCKLLDLFTEKTRGPSLVSCSGSGKQTRITPDSALLGLKSSWRYFAGINSIKKSQQNLDCLSFNANIALEV